VFKDRLEWLADDHEIEIPVDKEKCRRALHDVVDRDHEVPDSVVATARIMNHLGVDWTFRLDGYEATISACWPATRRRRSN